MELSPAGLLPPSWYQSWVLFQSLFFPNQGIERDRRAQAPSNLEEFEVNDLNYEDKLQEDRFLYSSIAFNLAADAGDLMCIQVAVIEASWFRKKGAERKIQ